MGSISGDESIHWDTLGTSRNEEKIFVAVRLRPLNDKEVGRNDVSEWECINNNTILLKNGLPERSTAPSAYTFDRVFGSECSTKQVYEEGPKKVALSVVSGINSSIFAYGQTSSGKTYTMRGITVYAMADIFDYIERHNDREYVLKFSAMEIYNESVRDLLGSDSTPLRLLDDPERGTVVEKLTEVSLKDWSHLKELLDVCEAERQIGETSLNAMSSRSHQIIRLTVESCAREFLGAENSSTLAATVNFIDLAGSERASQTLSAGSRLKEGSHINRSLLTLGTVIRKLSKGRNGHVPYRNSKLTRILQNSLGGNARTAIICTMSPAHSHVEQSRNTLLFATCAKEVSTNAQVNVVMSEKALVKQLQRELASLESELRSLQSTSTIGNPSSVLEEKERLIEKMDKEIRYLTQQRDLAESRVKEMQRSSSDNPVLRRWAESDNFSDTNDERSSRYYENSISDTSEFVDPSLDIVSKVSHLSDVSHGLTTINNHPQLPDHSDDHFLSTGSSPSEFMNKYLPDPFRGWEEISQKDYATSDSKCKEVRCIDIEPITTKNIEEDVVPSPSKVDGDLEHTHSGQGDDDSSKQMIKDIPITTDDCHVVPDTNRLSPFSSEADLSDSKSINLLKNLSCKKILTTVPFEEAEENGAPPNEIDIDFTVKAKNCDPKSKADVDTGMVSLDTLEESDSMDKKEQEAKTSCEVDINSLLENATNEDLKEKSVMQFDNNTALEANKIEPREIAKDEVGSNNVQSPIHGPSEWPLEFERRRKEIIQLWDACSIPLVHRSYFFLLFQGDQSDSVYMEVELRRLSFLMQTTSLGTSAKALKREREMLSRQILKKYSAKEREALYQKWGIMLNTKKRRQQLSRRLWKDTDDMDHIKESAALVAKLVGEPSQTPKEIFGLSFAPQHGRSKSSSWKYHRGSFAPY